jgi:hypothetical protein
MIAQVIQQAAPRARPSSAPTIVITTTPSTSVFVVGEELVELAEGPPSSLLRRCSRRRREAGGLPAPPRSAPDVSALQGLIAPGLVRAQITQTPSAIPTIDQSG